LYFPAPYVSMATPTSSSYTFGNGVDTRPTQQLADDEVSAKVELDFNIQWSTRLNDGRIALLTNKSSVMIWDTVSDVQSAQEILLHPLVNPVGSTLYFQDDMLAVACFGDDAGTSGLALIDTATSKVSTFPYPDSNKHVHNVKLLTRPDGTSGIYALILGNPWSSPPVTGDGLVHFDIHTSSFDVEARQELNARSAVQRPDKKVYALTQQPGNQATVLALLSFGDDGISLSIEQQVELPDRDGGDGGADVFLTGGAAASDGVWATDRTGGNGKLYWYDSKLSLLSTHDTGVNPRYSTSLDDGDIVVCNQDANTMDLFQGLTNDPQAKMDPIVLQTITTPMFFLQ